MEGHGREELEERDDEYSAMAWEVAIRGKSGREIGALHESWATALLSRDAFDKAQVWRTRMNSRLLQQPSRG